MDDDFKICDIGNVFAYIWRTSGDTVKRSGPVDSARRIGLKMLLKKVLTAGEVSVDSDLKLAILGTFLLTAGEPVKIQQNEWHHSIQRIK